MVGEVGRHGLEVHGDQASEATAARGTTNKATSGKCLYWAMCLCREYPGCGTAPVKANAKSEAGAAGAAAAVAGGGGAKSCSRIRAPDI